MARTRTQLRQLVAQQFMPTLITGTSGTGTTTTLVDLPDLGQFQDDVLIGAWVYVSGGSPNFRDLRIQDSVQSTGTATFIPALSAAPDALAYEILPYSATGIHQALDEAILEAYDRGILVRPVWLNHWVVDSPIYNSTFDYWPTTTTIDGWTVSGSTIAQRLYTSDPRTVPGEYAVRLTTTGTLTLDTKFRRFLDDFGGYTVTLYGWARTAAASAARFQLLEEGTVTASTGFHSGGSNWELLSVSRAIPAGIVEIYPRIDHTGATAADYGAVWMTGGPRCREYPFPMTLAPDGPEAIYVSPVNIDTGNAVTTTRPRFSRPISRWEFIKYRQGSDDLGMIRLLGNLPSSGHRLWMPTNLPPTLPTADTDNVEITLQDSYIIAKMAAIKLLKKNPWGGALATSRKARERVAELESEVEELSKGRGSAASQVAPLSPGWY